MLSLRDVRHRSAWIIATCVAAVALAALTGGCGIFSPNEVKPGDEGGGGTPPKPFPEARTESILIDNLVRAYNERNPEEYEEMLHELFVFYFAPDEVDVLGQGLSWDRARDVKSAYNMFYSQPGQKPDGSPQAPVQRIQLKLTPDDGDAPWTDQVAEEFAGTTMKRYKVDMDVFYTEGNPNQVKGLQEFYAVPVQVEREDGTTVTIYKLKFWRDLGKDTV